MSAPHLGDAGDRRPLHHTGRDPQSMFGNRVTCEQLQSSLEQRMLQERSLAIAINPYRPMDRFMRLPEVLRVTGLSRSTLYAKIAAGRFPKQQHIGENTVAWYESEVAGWMCEPS